MKGFLIAAIFGIMALLGSLKTGATTATKAYGETKIIVHGQETDLDNLKDTVNPPVMENWEMIPEDMKIVIHGHEMNLNDLNTCEFH